MVGHLVKKYKLLRKLGKETGMSRNKLSKITSKSIIVTKISSFREIAKTQKEDYRVHGKR